MPKLCLRYRVETHRLSAPFRISGYVFETSDVVVVELSDGDYTGRGEAAGVYYLGDDSAHIVEELGGLRLRHQAHHALGDPVAGEEAFFDARKDIDNGVANGEDIETGLGHAFL